MTSRIQLVTSCVMGYSECHEHDHIIWSTPKMQKQKRWWIVKGGSNYPTQIAYWFHINHQRMGVIQFILIKLRKNSFKHEIFNSLRSEWNSIKWSCFDKFCFVFRVWSFLIPWSPRNITSSKTKGCSVWNTAMSKCLLGQIIFQISSKVKCWLRIYNAYDIIWHFQLISSIFWL